jgi:hypothetical protein
VDQLRGLATSDLNTRNAQPIPLLNGMDRIFLFIIASGVGALAAAWILLLVSELSFAPP